MMTNSSAVRTYRVKAKVHKMTKEEMNRREEAKRQYFQEFKAYAESRGIIAEKTKLFWCLLYRFKKATPYYSLLYNVYLEDFGKEAIEGLVWQVATEHEADDFRGAYKSMQIAIETETAITRRKKQAQVFRPLSLDEMDIADDGGIDKKTKEIDLQSIYAYIRNTCTSAQLEAIGNYLSEGKKIDSRNKRRILERLRTSDFHAMLQG